VLLYTSRDGRNWTYLHPLAQGKWNGSTKTNPVASGEMWECPDFFPLGEKHVVLYSTEGNVYWEVGRFDKSDLRFHSESKGVLDHGRYYAMKSMVDAKGRRILWGWVQETRTPDECKAAGWAGAMALPRVLSLGADNQLRMDVPPEFATLRKNTQKVQAAQVVPIENRAAEIECSFKAGDNACGLELRAGSTPLFAILYAGGNKPLVSVGGKSLPLSPDHNGVSTIHLWMDGSIIETFVDRKEAMTARCFASSPAGIQLAWTGAADAFKSLTVSGVTPISNDRLTT
jgi:beta-fructofuranosidase